MFRRALESVRRAAEHDPVGGAIAPAFWPPMLVGLAVWVSAVVLLPAPLAARILLLAPLVIVPRLVGLLPRRRWLSRIGGWPALLAALPLVVAFGLDRGPIAAAFVLPWLGLALIGAAATVHHGLSMLPSILRPAHLADLGIDVAVGFWGVGATFLLLDRLGAETGFVPIVVLLTAVHFHFAGFGLLAMAGLSVAAHPWLRVCVLGLITGILVTALGFVLMNDAVSAVGALAVGSSGIGVAVAFLSGGSSGRRVWLYRAAGAALLVSMPMGIAWSLAILANLSFIDLDMMVRTHGVLNSTGVLLAVVAYGEDA